MKQHRLPHLLSGIILLTAVFHLHGCDSPADNRNDANNATNGLPYGNLLDVKTAPGTPSQFKQYTGMDLSFNASTHIPNWVAWELTEDELNGSVGRSDDFYTDHDVAGCPSKSDYKGSGYDRGHMAPAGDMKWSESAMYDTFSLANICPQNNSLNTGAWKNLEEKCRIWASIDKRLVIICGPIIDDTPIGYIGDNNVWVPKRFFKVILAPYSTPARGIGFIMPNAKVEGGMQTCAVSIDEVERITGHDFFHTLPDDIENALESQCDFPQWSTLRK